LKGTNTLRIYSANIILILLALIPSTSFAQKIFFTQENCTIIYSLERSADKYFNNEIAQLSVQINKKNIYFIDLNNWGKTPPHIEISGRLRHQLRQKYDLKKGINQAILVNKAGRLLSRYNGSVTLVNALIDCK
jgi:hypothetical protein